MAMVTDPVADMLARIRNGSLAEHEKVDIPSSKLRVRLAEILKEEGFIKNFRLIEDKRQGVLRVYLKYGRAERSSAGCGASPSRGGACSWARTASRACSGGWGWRSCPPRGGCSRTGSPARPRSAGRSSATSGNATRRVASGARDGTMSRIGRKPIAIPKGVQVGIQGQQVEVKGPKGRLEMRVHDLCSVKVADGSVMVGRGAEHRSARALHGLTRWWRTWSWSPRVRAEARDRDRYRVQRAGRTSLSPGLLAPDRVRCRSDRR
jgi:hypothetical protein